MSRATRLFQVVVVFSILLSIAWAQHSGSRGGLYDASDSSQAISASAKLEPEMALGYATLEGKAEVRVKPTEIRIVLAITSEGKTPSECKSKCKDKMVALEAAWEKMGIPEASMVEDFIAVLPRYEFQVEKMEGRDVAVERKSGYVMQTNIHLAVKDDAMANQVLDVAFDQDISDIIAFDYWSKDLDEMKKQAQKEAVAAAQAKADNLLGLFEKRPLLINVEEKTTVRYPESMYESFTNSQGQSFQMSYSNRDIPKIVAYRPKNTYYRGFSENADVTSRELPMQPEISVVSTVRLYYESPATKQFVVKDRKRD